MKVSIETLPQLPDPRHSLTVFDPVDPETLTPIQRVAVDALQAELARLRAAVLQVGAVLMSIHQVEQETAFPYKVAESLDVGDLILQVGDLEAEFDERFRLVLRPWLNRSRQAEDVAARVRSEMAGA